MSDLNISEIFTSIQGEGIQSGRPSIFIRFSGCNQSCIWCDTPPKPPNPEITLETIINLMESHQGYDVVITGGEPLLYPEQIKSLLKPLRNAECTVITIETNGTIFPPRNLAVDLYSVSPKLSTSGTKYSLPVIEYFAKKQNVQFKFVVGIDDDLLELQEICKHIPEHTNIIIQPVAYSSDKPSTYLQTYKNLINNILDLKLINNIRITPQLHKLIWGFDTSL